MKTIHRALITLVACLGITGIANATVVTLDFDTAATGLNIVSTPLSTTAGTITASTSGGPISVDDGTPEGYTGNVLRHSQSVDSDFAQLAFDFNASSVTFLYGGYTAGAFLAEILDASLNVLDSFFDDDTINDSPGGPVTLSGSGIRYFRFSDTPSAGSYSDVDNVQIQVSVAEPTTSGVDNEQSQVSAPEPTTLALIGLGLAGIGYQRRRSNKTA